MSIFPSEDFEQTILANWAQHFRCPVETLLTRGFTQVPASRYAGDRVVVLTHIAAHTFVEFDPAYTALMERLAGRVRQGETMTGVELVRVLGGDVFEGQDVTLMYYLYPPDLPELATPKGFTVRPLTAADAPAMTLLHDRCAPEEVDDGYVEVTHEAPFGCFDVRDGVDERLVAAATGYMRAGFVDIGVLTDPEYRLKGLGKLAVAALARWAIEQDRIAQYRANTTNAASHAVARSLKFRLYFHSEALWFAE